MQAQSAVNECQQKLNLQLRAPVAGVLVPAQVPLGTFYRLYVNTGVASRCGKLGVKLHCL